MDSLQPIIAVMIPPKFFSSIWIRHDAYEAIREAVSTKFSEYKFNFGIIGSDTDKDVQIFHMPPLNTESRSTAQYEDIPDGTLAKIRALIVDICIAHERQALGQLQLRLERCSQGLSEFQRRPRILSELMFDVSEFYGFVIETDLAMLMAVEHFSQVAKGAPDSKPQFIRNQKHIPREGTPPHQYSRPVRQIVNNYSLSGRNRTIRNRTIIIFLYELWAERYRPAVAAEVMREKNDIASDVFGDLRHYRNSLAHGGERLKEHPKALPFVKKGEKINLWMEMDELFTIVVEELNRLAQTYFGVTTNFTLDNISTGVIVAHGPSWSYRDDQ